MAAAAAPAIHNQACRRCRAMRARAFASGMPLSSRCPCSGRGLSSSLYMATPEWLQQKLFERRMVFVTGRLDDALAGQAAAQIMALDSSGDAPIDLFLDSGDGTLEAA